MAIKLDGVMETLLITLYARAKDAKSSHPVINDQKAVEMLERIDYDFQKFERGKMSYYGVLARAKTMDDQVKKFIAENPDCVIISVGCGLDTRFLRVDNGKIRWYNLDFPAVIAQREQFFDPHERVVNIGKSALDPTWTQDVVTQGKKLLILSEGVLMYFKEEEVRTFLGIVTQGFDSFEAQFDLLYKGAVNKGRMHDTVKNTTAEFHWGVKDGSEVVALCPMLQKKKLINFTGELKYLLPKRMRIFTPLMYIVNNRLGIYTYQKGK